MATKNDLKSLVGQLFIVGFDGLSVPDEFKKCSLEYNLGGTIYFKRNVESPAQLAELSNEIQFSCRDKNSPYQFISIDHEGGVVNRLDKPFTKFPGIENLGVMGSPKMAFQFGFVIAKELKSVGINIDFAPVVDVNTNPSNPVMKNRMFSSDPEVCAKMGSAFCRGLQKMFVMAVLKHFPGHGDTTTDSHFELPKINKSLAELEKCEFIPFKRAFRSRVDGLMTAHILNTAVDAEYPATLSEKTINYLRNELRYSKIIFSDDLEMKAIADHYGAEEAAVLAIKAGCDSLIYRGDSGFPEKQIEAIIKAVESNRIPRKRIEDSVSRIIAAKKVYADVKQPLDVTEVSKFIGLPDHARLANAILNKEILLDIGEESADLT